MDFLDANLRNIGPVEVMLVPFVAPLIQLVSQKAQEILSRARERKQNNSRVLSEVESKAEETASESVSQFLTRAYELFTTVFEANIKILAQELLDDGEDAIQKASNFWRSMLTLFKFVFEKTKTFVQYSKLASILRTVLSQTFANFEKEVKRLPWVEIPALLPFYQKRSLDDSMGSEKGLVEVVTTLSPPLVLGSVTKLPFAYSSCYSLFLGSLEELSLGSSVLEKCLQDLSLSLEAAQGRVRRILILETAGRAILAFFKFFKTDFVNISSPRVDGVILQLVGDLRAFFGASLDMESEKQLRQFCTNQLPRLFRKFFSFIRPKTLSTAGRKTIEANFGFLERELDFVFSRQRSSSVRRVNNQTSHFTASRELKRPLSSKFQEFKFNRLNLPEEENEERKEIQVTKLILKLLGLNEKELLVELRVRQRGLIDEEELRSILDLRTDKRDAFSDQKKQTLLKFLNK